MQTQASTSWVQHTPLVLPTTPFTAVHHGLHARTIGERGVVPAVMCQGYCVRVCVEGGGGRGRQGHGGGGGKGE